MKKSIFTIVLATMILLPSAGLFAQATDNADVEATVSVQAALALGTVTNIDFGLVALGGAAVSLDADGSVSGITGSPVVGKVEVTGATGVDVSVSWNTDVTMTDAGAANPVAVTPDVHANETADDNALSSQLSTPAGSTITLTGGNTFLYFGGSFTPPTSAAGTWNTTNGGTAKALTVTVDYI